MRRISSILKISSILGAILIVGGYAYLTSENFIAGPSVDINQLSNGMTVTDPLLTIKGVASQISFINMNDRKIFTDQDGLFKEEVLLYPGYNVITIAAQDRFNRKVEKTLEVVYKEKNAAPATAFKDSTMPATN